MRSATAALDHLVLATPDISATAAWVEERTGIRASPGGQHVGKGTRNMLCSLSTTSYLEIVGPDPEQPTPSDPRPFGIDGLREPRLMAWASKSSDPERTASAAEGHA